MKSSLVTIIVVLFFVSLCAQAQKEDYVWRVGYTGGVDFNMGYADTFTVGKSWPILTTNASICDSSGKFLFCTNGINIYNLNSDIILNGNNLNPSDVTYNDSLTGLGVSGADIVIQRPNNPNQYYLFHETFDNDSGTNYPFAYCNVLYLSVIDMSLDSGRGGVTNVKNHHLYDNDTLQAGKLAAVRHANGRDWWLILKKQQAPLFYKWLIEPDTIVGPFVQSNQPATDTAFNDGFGQACFSPLGDKYAVVYEDESFYLYNFDRCTGDLTYIFSTILNDSSTGSGCAFSPSNRYLYVATAYVIYQYDLWAGNILASQTVIGVYDGFQSPFATCFNMMKLAPDGKIYVCTGNGCNVLHTIEYPDSTGLNCNLKQHSFLFNNINIGINSIPNIPDYNLGALEGSPCDTLLNTVTNLQKNNAGVSVYPNPSNGIFHFRNNTYEEIEKIEVFNCIGQNVLASPPTPLLWRGEIDLSSYSSGFYFYRTSIKGGKVFSGKIIKD